MANSLSSISAAMTEVVKLLSQLVKVCGDCKASSSVTHGSAVKFKAEFEEDEVVEAFSRLTCYGATS